MSDNEEVKNDKKKKKYRRTKCESDTDDNLTKGPWKKEEDKLLLRLVKNHGSKDWSCIATKMASHGHFRIGKQCRERWFNHLNPEVKKGAWTEEEDELIIKAHSEMGNKWTEISKMLVGRPANSIKNHWNSTLKRRLAGALPKRKSKRRREDIDKDEEPALKKQKTDSSSSDIEFEENSDDSEDDADGDSDNKRDEKTPTSTRVSPKSSSLSEIKPGGAISDHEDDTKNFSSSCNVTNGWGYSTTSFHSFVPTNFSGAIEDDVAIWYEACLSTQVVPEQPWTGGYLDQYFASQPTVK